MSKDQLINQISYISLVNLYTLSKETNKIHIYDLDEYDEGHLSVVHLAKALDSISASNKKIIIHTNWIKYLKLKFKTFKNIKIYKGHAKRLNSEGGPNCQEFIEHIEFANDAKGIFKEIYERDFKNV